MIKEQRIANSYSGLIDEKCELVSFFLSTEQNRTLLKTMHLRPLTGGVRDKHKHVMQ